MELSEGAVATQEGADARRRVLDWVGRDRERVDAPALGSAQQIERSRDL
jgi:hypothetical protein